MDPWHSLSVALPSRSFWRSKPGCPQDGASARTCSHYTAAARAPHYPKANSDVKHLPLGRAPAWPRAAPTPLKGDVDTAPHYVISDTASGGDPRCREPVNIARMSYRLVAKRMPPTLRVQPSNSST